MRDRLVLVDIFTKKFKSISYKQYDVNNLLQIVVMENKSIVDISNYIATVYFEMPSGNVYQINGTINNNTINVLLSKQVLSEHGQVMVEVELTNFDQIVTTFTFYLNIEKSINKVSASVNTDHTHLNKDILDQITQEMIDTISLGGGLVDLSIYQTKRDTKLNTTDKTVVGAINELNEKIENGGIGGSCECDKHTHNNKNVLDSITESKIQEWNNKSNFDGNYNSLTNKPTIPTRTSQLTNDSGFLTQHQSLNNYALKSEIPTVPTKVSQLTNDKGYAVQPNFNFQINMIASTEQPSVTTTGTYPNLVITFNIPQGTSSGGSDEPIVAEKAIYYGRLSISEVGGRVIQYNEITDTMIKNGANITKITPQTLGKTSVGKQSETAEGDYVIIAVPKNEGYVVTQDNGFGGKAIFNKEVAGTNGDYTVTIDGNEYALYGEILIAPAETFIYIDKN